jgi:ribosome-associated protein
MNIESKTEKPSKSARKREIAALQELAEQMVALSDSELQRLGIDESLRLEIQQVRSIRPSGARNRQLKHCVKYLDSQDLSAVRAYLADQHSQQIAANRQLHEIERWRDRLIEEGDSALQLLFDNQEIPDRQHLRRLCRDAIRENESGRPAGAARKLFRYLRDVLVGAN